VISLEQVRALEDRVEKAVAYISSLREEGAELGRRLAEAQSFIDGAADEVGAAEAKLSAAEKQLVVAETKAAEAEKLAQAAEAKLSASEARAEAATGRLADMAERVAAAEARLAASEARAAELSARAEEYRRDQAKIEEGIVHALEKLDSFEDLVLSQAGTSVQPDKANSKASASGAGADEKAEAKAVEPAAPIDAAVESVPPAEMAAPAQALDPEPEIETVENELDIF
jgi:chromosome segregation ATPase